MNTVILIECQLTLSDAYTLCSIVLKGRAIQFLLILMTFDVLLMPLCVLLARSMMARVSVASNVTHESWPLMLVMMRIMQTPEPRKGSH